MDNESGIARHLTASRAFLRGPGRARGQVAIRVVHDTTCMGQQGLKSTEFEWEFEGGLASDLLNGIPVVLYAYGAGRRRAAPH